MRRLFAGILPGLIPAIIILAGAGCGGGSGQLAQDASTSVDTYVALDLASGKVVPLGSDRTAAEADPANRTSRILFRRIPAGRGTIGCPGNLSQPSERDPQEIAYDEFFCAVYETTQAQWALLSGTTPWSSSLFDAAFTDKSKAVDPLMPAWGMTCQQAIDAAASWSHSGWRVDLPSSTEWEIACRAGMAINLFPWGNLTDPALARNRAVFWELTTPDPLPQQVGKHSANAWGLHDFIGNVWEFAIPGEQTGSAVELRGGAYDQPLIVCRASNKMVHPRGLATTVAGVRLVLRRTGN